MCISSSLQNDDPRDAQQHELPYIQRPRRLSSLILKPSSSVVAASESLAVYCPVRHCCRLCPLSSYIGHTDEAWRRYLEYRESEDFLARSRQASTNRNTEVEGPWTGPSKHDGGSVSFATTNERLLHRRCQKLTQATPNKPVDDEVVYYNVAGGCPQGRVYGLWSLGRKKRRYADLGASISQLLEMVPRSEFDSVTKQLPHVVVFMQRQFGMTMDGAGLSQPQPPPPPPPPHEQQ
ncbi:hypothetical protein Syun_027758 [Stephania yunnanensis]|uniref:Uncharacterized protein n=1 Tax=Stephania yunnanensis TaxID=152371 RepID=A0AAP0HQ83_9MAGN